MKYLLIFSFMLITLLSFGQDSSNMDVLVMNTSTNFELSKTVARPINLNITRYKDYDDKSRNAYLTVFLAGIAFTTAAALEDNRNYGTWVGSNYVIPTFWKQTPRQIMLLAGVGLTITGGVLTFR